MFMCFQTFFAIFANSVAKLVFLATTQFSSLFFSDKNKTKKNVCKRNNGQNYCYFGCLYNNQNHSKKKQAKMIHTTLKKQASKQTKTIQNTKQNKTKQRTIVINNHSIASATHCKATIWIRRRRYRTKPFIKDSVFQC